MRFPIRNGKDNTSCLSKIPNSGGGRSRKSGGRSSRKKKSGNYYGDIIDTSNNTINTQKQSQKSKLSQDAVYNMLSKSTKTAMGQEFARNYIQSHVDTGDLTSDDGNALLSRLKL